MIPRNSNLVPNGKCSRVRSSGKRNMTNDEKLVDILTQHPKGLTIREIHINGWIQNVPDAAKVARGKGHNITTEYLHPNPKIATYVLHQPQPKPKGKVPSINLLPIQGQLL